MFCRHLKEKLIKFENTKENITLADEDSYCLIDLIDKILIKI